MSERFSNLEPENKIPLRVQNAIARISRFDQLEIGDMKPSGASARASERRLCRYCHQANEEVRDVCWACWKPLREDAPESSKPAPEQEVAVVIDGATYRSSDPRLPPDIAILIERIRREGYSDAMFSQWQRDVQRKIPAPAESAAPPTPAPGVGPEERVQAWRGQRVSILRIDGKLYKSDDPNLPPDIKELLDYIERDGVSPPLMQHLRLYGTKVKYRPIATVQPSDGDMNFWGEVRKAFKREDRRL